MCTAAELPNALQALKHVDVISPNHMELGGFFEKMDHVDHRLIERLCRQLLENGIGPDGKGGVVVRCGKEGCYIARPGLQRWSPAYHQSSEKVVDPTGGGNGFLGGLAIGLVRRGGMQSLEEAAIWGSISASFAIEQVGMPILAHSPQGETWNGVRVEDRLEEFRKRVGSYVQP